MFFLLLGCIVSIKADDENDFEALFSEDEHMTLHSYPEMLFLDVTYKLTELRLPVYLILVEDDSVGKK